MIETHYEISYNRGDWLHLGSGGATRRPGGNPDVPHAYAYVCPHCLHVWARIRISGQAYVPRARPCPIHGPGYLIPHDHHHTKFPRKVMVREVDLIHVHNPKQYSRDISDLWVTNRRKSQ